MQNPQTPDALFGLLARRSGSESRAFSAIEDLSSQLGLENGSARDVLAAMALVRDGVPPESVSSLMSWREFEEFCAKMLRASGYSVKHNIVITKPRRQIDIFADSPNLALSIDCKHWGRGFAPSSLRRIVAEQVERTTLYKKKMKLEVPVLPVVLTLLDSSVRLVEGVPIVPVFAMRDFITSVSGFEEGLAVI